MRIARLLRLCLTAFLSALMVAAPACAVTLPSTPKMPKIPKVKSVVMKVDIVGDITVTHDFDSTGPCQWGQAYTVEENFLFETGKAVPVRFTNTSFPGKESVFGAAVTKPVGSAITTGRVDGWRTTNDCAIPQPDPAPPTCRAARGKLTFLFVLAGQSGSDDEDLTPLIGRSLMLYLTRKGGGNQDSSCTDWRPSINPVGQNYGDTYVDTNLMDGVNGAILPTGIDSIKAFNIKKGKTITRTVTLTGPCEAAQVANKAGGTLTAAPGQCWVKGKVVVTLKRAK